MPSHLAKHLQGKEFPPRSVWKPIVSAPHNKFILVRSPSGYGNCKYEIMMARYIPDYKNEFTTVGNTRLSYYGLTPTEWTEIPE